MKAVCQSASRKRFKETLQGSASKKRCRSTRASRRLNQSGSLVRRQLNATFAVCVRRTNLTRKSVSLISTQFCIAYQRRFKVWNVAVAVRFARSPITGSCIEINIFDGRIRLANDCLIENLNENFNSSKFAVLTQKFLEVRCLSM